MRFFLILALCTALAACSGPLQTAEGTEDTTIRGTVAVAGSAPMNTHVEIRRAGEASVRIAGPLADELRRLGRADVSVTGRLDGRTLHATAYDIVAVDGAPVVFGTVERAPDGGLQLRTASGDVFRLSGPAADFEVGQKIWVQGPQAVQVQKFGVVRQ